ncbi:hypothetical protein C8R43DRAFT_1116920 [Mycena crocata]|nr:hypothetical protein C8R43DRAFT_1116920 [Mycena crocata]
MARVPYDLSRRPHILFRPPGNDDIQHLARSASSPSLIQNHAYSHGFVPDDDAPSNHPVPMFTSSSIPVFQNSCGLGSQPQTYADPLPSLHARSILQHGGMYITAQTVNHNEHSDEIGISILHRAVALEALFDSAESFPQPRCHPKTRTEILDDLFGWAVGKDSACPMRWLHGPAGAGKSAVMQSLCQRLQGAGHLGGSFFFKRGHPTRGNARVLFATLAYQLALQNPVLRRSISQIVQEDPSVVGRSIDAQLQALIVQPCQSFRDRTSHVPILLIDGWDECDGQTIQQEVLRLLGDVLDENPDVLRILVASRPEPHIRKTFERPSLNAALHRSLHIHQSFKDAERYLYDEFARIRREHRDTMTGVPTPWPSSKILDLLVEKSSGYFIYASTIIKFVDDSDFRPTERLATLVKNVPSSSDPQPFEALDLLYMQILRSVPAQLQLVRILCVLENFKLSLGDIEQLLDLSPGDVQLSLRRLHSVMRVPSDGSTISMYHASFRDFLADPTRSDEFCVDALERHDELARSVLKALSYSYENSDGVPSTSTHVAWRLGCSGIDYLTASVPPAKEFLSLIQAINPEFLWRPRNERTIQKMVDWLKVILEMEPTSVAADLVQLWEDYQVVNLYGDEMSNWYTKHHRRVKEPTSEFKELFSRFPQLLKVLQVAWMCYVCSLNQPPDLFDIRLLLDMPWSEMREAVIRPLKSNAAIIPLLLSSANTATLPCETTRLDLAQGCVQVLRKIARGRLPWQMWWVILDIF